MYRKTQRNSVVRIIAIIAVIIVFAFLCLPACNKQPATNSLPDGEPAKEQSATSDQKWPISLRVNGNSFLRPGRPCRIILESAATSNYLDDSANLVGRFAAEDALMFGRCQSGAGLLQTRSQANVMNGMPKSIIIRYCWMDRAGRPKSDSPRGTFRYHGLAPYPRQSLSSRVLRI